MIFPVILDSRPEFLRQRAGSASLLLAHVGTATLLEHVASRLGRLSDAAPAVVAQFADEPGYAEALRAKLPRLRAVVGAHAFRDWLVGCEPSDFLLLIDPRCFPVDGMEDNILLRHPAADPRWARHLVALDLSAAGTRERLDFDGAGQVRRIQRHYEAVTWPFSNGVACSLLPVTCGLVLDEFSVSSLGELRRVLASAGVPSRDLPLQGPALDLTQERGLLQLSEILVLEACGRSGNGAVPVMVGEGQRIHATARVVGPVVLHAGVEVGEDAVVLGPAVLGPGVRVGAGAIVAQSLLASGMVVPPRFSLRHRALFEPLPPAPPALRDDGAVAYPGPEPVLHTRAAEVPSLSAGIYVTLKPLAEVVLASAALLVLLPLFLVVALLIRLDSLGPVLYGHRREGRGGRAFKCWKFRTMFDGAEAQQRALAMASNEVDGPQFKMNGDPRITRVGRWLRPTSIDELPQLINVALGQMSFVGPRPSPFRENQLCVPWREARLSVRPGITGLWQVCRHDRHEADFHQWIQYDLLYVRHVSYWVDVKILLATLWTGGGKSNVPLGWILPASVQAASAAELSQPLLEPSGSASYVSSPHAHAEPQSR